MTKTEFDKWTRCYFDAFPDTLAWLNKCENPAATLATWYQVLAGVDYSDVVNITAKLIVGELPPIENFQRENTPRHVRAYIGRVTDDRNKRAIADREREANIPKRQGFRRNDGPLMGSMYKEIIKFREAGADQGLVGVALNEYAAERLEGFVAQHGKEVAGGFERESDEDTGA